MRGGRLQSQGRNCPRSMAVNLGRAAAIWMPYTARQAECPLCRARSPESPPLRETQHLARRSAAVRIVWM